jgi:hypothetical protein
LAHSMYHGTHNWESEFWSFRSQAINDCNNSVHRLKKNGINMINPDNMKKVANKYVIKIQTHLFFVSLCRKIIHHSNANEMMNAAITM